ncbi:hypothetical protein NPX13_g3029 [Xylaria arbuscula]|uniref:Zn(2)-C6 fungal-type domain-containing protein n=1 Tax=Xylaria arbuscula TaxID=114810 RepID=A0A9W8NIZ0_9PEZI|nr:hypothetical protein NPX13_g3029 [Xylaria arbuscula]
MAQSIAEPVENKEKTRRGKCVMIIEAFTGHEQQPIDDSNSDRPRKRRRYSYLKCSFCRRDKQRCTPQGRLNGQRCHRCLEKGFACSPSMTTKASKEETLAMEAQYMASGEPLLEDLIMLLSWHRMLFFVESVALRIATHMRRGERSLFGFRGEGLRAITYGIQRLLHEVISIEFPMLVQALASEKDLTRRQVISSAVKAHLQAHPTIYGDKFLDQIHELTIDETLSTKETNRRLTAIDDIVNILHMPYWNSNNTMRGNNDLVAERYIRAWEGLQEQFEDMCLRHSLPLTMEKFPFVHDLWLRRTGGSCGFLRSLKVADTNSTLKEDYLGRSSLHFQLDNAYELYRIGEYMPSELEEGKNILIDTADAFGRTPLHIACAMDRQRESRVRAPLDITLVYQHNLQLEYIKRLLERDANINLRDAWDLRAIDYAIIDRREDILDLFHKIRGVQVDDIRVKIRQAREATRNALAVGDRT